MQGDLITIKLRNWFLIWSFQAMSVAKQKSYTKTHSSTYGRNNYFYLNDKVCFKTFVTKFLNLQIFEMEV